MCYDLAHQIRCAKHTFSGRCDITPMVCCSFGGHSTPQFLQCMYSRRERERRTKKVGRMEQGRKRRKEKRSKKERGREDIL